MPTNDFKAFTTSNSATYVISQATYAAMTTLLAQGFEVGIANPTVLNKVWRQASIIASMIGQFVVDQAGVDMLDDGTIATLETNFVAALKVVAGSAATSNATIATTGGTTTLNATQYANSFITIQGVLVSNATIVFPAGLQKWTVLNKTTGAFTVTCKVSGQTGVTVAQGRVDEVAANGTDVVYDIYDVGTRAFGDNSVAAASTAYVDRAIADVSGYYQDTGIVDNAYIVALTPPITDYTVKPSFRVKTTRTGTGASTLDAGGGAIPLVREDGQPTQSGDIFGIFNVQYNSGDNKFYMIGLAISQLGACAKENIGQGLEDDGAGNLRVKLSDTSLRRTASGVQKNSPLASVGGGTHNIVATDNGGAFVLTGNEVFQAPLASSLWNGFSLSVVCRDGALTFTPNAIDKVNNAAVGLAYTLVQGQSANFICDGAGNWQPEFITTAPGAYAPKYINANTTIAAGTYDIDCTSGAVALTLVTNPTTGDSVRLRDVYRTWIGTNFPTVDPNGGTIENVAAVLTCNTPNMEFSLSYNGTTWKVVK